MCSDKQIPVYVDTIVYVVLQSGQVSEDGAIYVSFMLIHESMFQCNNWIRGAVLVQTVTLAKGNCFMGVFSI